MSRTIKVKGNIFIKNKSIAISVIQEFKNGIYFENNQFKFEKYDANDRISQYDKEQEMQIVENEYLRRYEIFTENQERIRVEQEKRLIALQEEQKRIQEKDRIEQIEKEKQRIKREEEERIIAYKKEQLRIEEEKRVIRDEKADLMIANAKKQGYKLKKEIREDNTIKLVLQKRVY